MPTRLTGTIDNSLARPGDLLDVMEAHPHLWERLSTASLLVKTEGRPRMSGEWALAYLLYANSAERELTRWRRSTSDALWQRVGFEKTPSYQAVYKNFTELEEHEAVYREVAAVLVQTAVEQSGGKVGHAVHVDGTEAEAHSRLVHDCCGDELDTCKKQAQAPRRVTNGDAREERHALAEQAPTDEELYGAAEDLAADERGLRVLVGGCWYRLSDVEAGIRAYVTSEGKVRKFWAGYYNAKAVDHYTGGVLATHVTHASTQEHVAYPDLYEQIKQQLGTTPRVVVADRGYSIASVYELHTRDGVASVMPWRMHWRQPERVDHERYDRHGIPRCQHCDGETTYVNFRHDDGPYAQPRLWFRCARPMHSGCERVQSITCARDWRLLLPLWRTSEAYQVYRATHQQYEATHHRWRERYAVAGDCKADRFKRRGLGVQQLRASAALVIEWLTICHREGWLGGPRVNDRTETRVQKHQITGYVRKLLTTRAALGLSGVARENMAAHQSAIRAAYQSSTGYGAASAHGPLVTRLLDEERVRQLRMSGAEGDGPILGDDAYASHRGTDDP